MGDEKLLKKYDVPGPRYTSYPTVPYWSDSPSESEWIRSVSESLTRSESKGVGAAIYVHIPFCKTLCTYCGCNTRITRRNDVGSPYVETLLKELDLYCDRLGDQKISVDELHLGGGTPTFLRPNELSALMDGIFSRVDKRPDASLSVEADPRTTERGHLEALAQFGFKRLSLGIQDFDPRVQEVVNRVQSVEQVTEVTQTARDLGYTSINFDLIYGLPFQTIESVENTVKVVQELRPERISFYSYAHVPWIRPGQRRFTQDDLPKGEEKRALYERGRELLQAAGYREIGMDHFALESDTLYQAVQQKKLHRNFMGYTDRQVEPLIGLGVSAISDSWGAFAQNEKQLEKYVRRVEAGEIPIHRGHLLNEEDLVLRRHILNLMCQLETNWNEDGLYTDHLETVPDRLKEFASDHLITVGDRQCEVTEEGRAFLRNVCMAFDSRLIQKSPETRLFSQTI